MKQTLYIVLVTAMFPDTLLKSKVLRPVRRTGSRFDTVGGAFCKKRKRKEKRKMKITLDKDLTTISQAAKVKEDMRQFKAFSDGDLKNAVCDLFGGKLYGSAVLSAEVSAFPGGWLHGDETHFCVNLVCADWRKFYRVRYYTDLSLSVHETTNERCKLSTFEEYDMTNKIEV